MLLWGAIFVKERVPGLYSSLMGNDSIFIVLIREKRLENTRLKSFENGLVFWR